MYENMDDFVVYSPVSDISDTVERSSPSQRDRGDDNNGSDGANRDNHRQHHHHAHYRHNHHQYRDHQSPPNGEHSRPQRELNPYDRNSRYPQRREREAPPGQDEYQYHHHRPHQPHHHHVDNGEYRSDSEDYRRPRRESPPPSVARRDRDTVDRGRQRQQHRPVAPLSEPSSTLVIKNMPIRVTEREISDTFSTLPGFRECARRSNRWGHGVYIEFDTIDSAQKAFHSVQSTRFHGQRNPLNVDYHGRDTTGGGADRHNLLKRRHDDPSRVEERRPGDRYKEEAEEPARYKRRSISPVRSDVDEKRRDGILPEPRSSERDHSHHRPSVDHAGHTRRDNPETLDRHQHHHYHSRPSHEENMRRDTRNDDRRYDGRDNEMRYVERRRSDDDGPPTHEHSMDGRYTRDRRPPYPDHYNNTTSPMQYGAPPSGPTVNRDGDLIHRLVSHVMPYRSFDEYADVVGMTPTGRPSTLYVCNIPQDIRERELHLFFRMSLPFPAVRSVRMIQNSRGNWIAFIDFSEYHAAMMAMHKLNGYVIDPTLPEGIKIDLDTKSK